MESGPNLNPAGEKGSVASTNPGNLVTFNERGTYSPPEFTWEKTIGPTAIAFLKSDKLGKVNENDVFVSDIKNGNIYHFKLNEDRTTFSVSGDLTDKVSNAGDNTQNILFATGFGGITDLKVGPDGYLSVLTFDKEDGRIYRIVPA
ncbi:MAG TPA: PQQ-dependent sugar dehydrogenase [Nitrososphaeraceae archaeon]